MDENKNWRKKKLCSKFHRIKLNTHWINVADEVPVIWLWLAYLRLSFYCAKETLRECSIDNREQSQWKIVANNNINSLNRANSLNDAYAYEIDNVDGIISMALVIFILFLYLAMMVFGNDATPTATKTSIFLCAVHTFCSRIHKYHDDLFEFFSFRMKSAEIKCEIEQWRCN